MIDFLIEPFRYEFMQRGLLVAVLLGLSGGLLGCILVLRRLALMGDALSHSLLPGIGVAYLIFGPSLPALLLGALLAGLLTALGSGFVSRLTRIKEDAAFGSIFLVFFAAGVVLVSKLPTRIDLMHFLFGNILGVGRTDVALAGAAAGLTLAVFVIFYRSIVLETFDPLFHRATGGHGGLTHLGILALCVVNLVAALQAMGIVLSLGLFLLPAVTAYLWCDRLPTMLAVSAATAVVGSVVGIFVSYHAGLPSGATIVLSLGVCFLVSALVSPRYGVIARLLRSRREGKAVRHTAE
jgi:zinc/manganese transport system permease protein